MERAPGLGGATLCEAFQLTAARFADCPALRTPGGAWALTWAQYARRVRGIAGGLAQLGVGRGDTVAMMLVNRPEFHLVDTAVMHLGGIPFSVYNSSAPEQIAYLFANAGNRVVVTERRFAETIRAVGAPGVEHVLVVEDGLPEGGHADFEATWRQVGPGDVATLIYTSGTTGPPKGVQLTHRNLLWALQATAAVIPLRPGGRVVSYLPCAHVADRFAAHYVSLATGSTLTSIGDPAGLLAGLADARPTGWAAVPRIWEKLKAALEAKGIDDPARLSGDQRAAVRAQLGLDQADWVVSGGAPIPPPVLEYFLALGLPIVEVWAMSETACAGTINPPGQMRAGTVGHPLPGIELALAGDGELLLRAPNAMLGYRNDPVRTAEAIDARGWLHTGDVAKIDADGYVTIIDRKKELIINAAGENMSPANIEQQLKASSPLIGQACAIGDRRPYNVALLVLDPDAAAAYAAARGRPGASPTELAADPDLHAMIAAAVESANTHLSRPEQIKRFAVVSVDWVADSDELTPTLKLKRRAILHKYAHQIDTLYT
jgi:long-subunit acyl-CoA synthetase (AMP-forming)